DILLHPLDDIVAQVLAGKELEVDQAVVVVEALVWSVFHIEPFDRRRRAVLADAETRFLIRFLFVHQLAEREQSHHILLRKRKAGRVFKCYAATISKDAVDESELAGLESEAAVALVQLFFSRLGMR